MEFNKFYAYDETPELLSEKLHVKLLDKFSGDSFEVCQADLQKQVLRNFAAMLQTTKLSVAILDKDLRTVARVHSYKYSGSEIVIIEFLDCDYVALGIIEIQPSYSVVSSKKVNFLPTPCEALKPLFGEILKQLLG